MYATLLSKIDTVLAGVTEVKERFNYPKTKIDKFPAVFFQPAGFTNSFETNAENKKVYRFLMVVIVGTANTTNQNVFGTVLPATVDAILAAFDSNWDGGSIAGHRTTVKIDSGDAWELVQDKDGVVAYAPLNVEIMVLTSV
jgi:hypothetical protein